MMLKIVILGSGNAFAQFNQYQSAHYIEFDENQKIILDCGPAILQAVQSSDVNIDDLDCLFISHLHGDHLAGLPFLLLYYKFVVNRINKPLHIYGPPGLLNQLENLFNGNYPNLLLNDNSLYEIHEIGLNETKKVLGSVSVTSFEANHIPNAFGYTVEKNNLKIIYSGDNEFKPEQIKYFDNGTVLIHEMNTMDSTAGGHTSWILFKEHIDKILEKVGKIIAVHTSIDVRNENESTFEQKLIRARDGSTFLFNDKGRLYQMML